MNGTDAVAALSGGGAFQITTSWGGQGLQGDVYPIGNPDGVISIMDALTVFRVAMGTVTLPDYAEESLCVHAVGGSCGCGSSNSITVNGSASD
ncbi:MAG: hypothetical protein H7831_16085 [Magnetococcus sp. WYHC-3]